MSEPNLGGLVGGIPPRQSSGRGELGAITFARAAVPGEFPAVPATRPGTSCRAGALFEQRAGAVLARAYPGAILKVHPRLYYEAGPKRGTIEPDVLVRLNGVTYLVEIKLTECVDAVEALRGRYLPVVQYLVGGEVVPLQLVRNLVGLYPRARDLPGARPYETLWIGDLEQ